MFKRTRLALIAFGALVSVADPYLSSPAVAADALRLRQLVTMCGRSGNESCRAYVMGVADGFRISSAAGKGELLFCLPEPLTASQIVATVVDSAKDDIKAFPLDSNMLAGSYIGAVLVKNYPCS